MNAFPSSDEAERSLIGCMLNAPHLLATAAVEARSEWFYFAKNRNLWGVLLEFHALGKPIDVILLQQYLMDREAPSGAKLIDEIGGPAALVETMSLAPAPANWPHYAEIIKAKFIRRRMLALADMAIKLSRDEEREEDELLRELEAELFDIYAYRDTSAAVHIQEALIQHHQHVDLIHKSRGRIAFGIATGIPDLDRTINGVDVGEMFIAGARPGVGKTNLLNRLVENISLRELAPVPGVFFTMEMATKQILTRMTHGAANIDMIKGRTGFYADKDLVDYAELIQQWGNRPLWIDETPDLTIGDICARTRLLHQRHGIKVLYLDYIQFVQPSTKRGQTDERLGIVEVCSGLKTLAKRLGITVFALAQANRDSEQNPGKLPNLRDFDGSSAIEKFADYAGFVHRPSKFIGWEKLKPDQQEFHGNEENYKEAASFLLVKNRNGKEASIQLRFIGRLSRFEPVTTKLYSNNESERQVY